MKVDKYLLPVFFLLFFFNAGAQILRGTVRDADNGAPITGATITLQRAQSGANMLSIATNPSGEFEFEGLRAGYYRCSVSAVGFDNQTFTEINIAAGKAQTLDISLTHVATALPNVTISTANPGRRPLQPLGEIPLTRDQTLRFPSMYFDPARLAAAYPGVAQTDDGINGMSIRGNSPASVRWHLEGVDVVNPNHLPNAGTFNDQPAGASGGILMFSAQMLDNSSLLTGAFPAGYGDALGGVMDMNLRRGNPKQHEFTAQAGLIGLDLAAEGPISGNGKNSYLANYRYSTVGLLGKMGISFGDEVIDFQDLSFKFNFSGKKGNEWSLFGLGGLSKNVFEHKADTSAIKQFKDFFDIDFKSKTGIIGLSNWSRLGPRTWLKIALAASAQTNDHESVYASDNQQNDIVHLEESKISGSATLSHRLSARVRLLAGAMLTRQDYMFNTIEDHHGTIGPDFRFLSSQPWVSAHWTSSDEKTSVQVGLHSLLIPYVDFTSVEPRLIVTQILSKQHRLAASWGRYSQIAPLWAEGEDVGVQQGWQAGLRHTWSLNDFWTLRTELFWQNMNKAGIAPGPKPISLLDASEFEMFSGDFLYNGDAENKGIEISLERYLNNDWFLAANTTLFDSRYKGNDGIWRSTRWNLGHLANLTVGKEWYRDRGTDNVRSFGLNGRIVWTGGFRERPIDAVASAFDRTTVFDTRNGFTEQQPDYFRFDLRAYWKRSLGNRRNSTLAMDFQNVTAQKNVAYHFYDPFTKKVETKYQLSLIPNISWRLEF